MASSQNTQLEEVLDEVLKSGDVHALDVFLLRDIYGGTPMKCSKQFLSKLDELICRSLDQKDSRSARLGLAIVYKCGENLKLPDGHQGLSGLIGQGLIKKMVQWFVKCRQLWIQCGPQWDEPLFNLSEDFFEVLMVVHEACKEGTYQITESFLYPVGQLGVDPKIYILIQKEAIRKFNLILDKIPVELKKERKILTSQKASDIMVKLAGQILEGGDYDLQTALMEALCRMATPAQRKAFADRWFSMEHVANAFVKICDLEFETDCRKFLNLVNGMQGDRRRVYSYPCLEAYLGKFELLMPIDEKLEEFWIDFNVGSNSISFYFSLPDEDMEGRWETICIHENEVQSYIVTDEGKMKVLQLKLSEVLVVGAVEGSSLAIHFSSSLDILQAAQNVYGHNRNKGFERKTSTSVVKTTVKVIVEENCTQVVPESQVSLGDSQKSTAPYLLPASSAPNQKVNPAKMKISESTTVISNSARGTVHDASYLSASKPSNAPAKSKGKPSLEMVRSCDRKGEFCVGDQWAIPKTPSNGTTSKSTKAGGMLEKSNMSLQSLAFKQTNKTKADKYEKKIPNSKAVDMVLPGHGEEQSQSECNFVPDTQPRPVKNISANWSKLSVSEMLTMPTQEIKTRPEPCSNLAQQQKDATLALPLSVPGPDPASLKQLHTELTQRLQQVITEKNQGQTPRKPAATQRILSGARRDLEGKSSPDQQVQQAQRKGSLREGKSKSRMAQEAGVGPIKAPIKAPMTKALHDKLAPNIQAETKRPPSSKEKKDAVVTGSMMKAIASHYKLNTRSVVENTHQSWVPPVINRQIFNMSCLSTAKKNVFHTSVNLMKTHINTASMPSRLRKDVFAFTSESPLSTGGKKKPMINTSASTIQNSSGIYSPSEKRQSVAKNKTRITQASQNKENQNVKKHLFSDTDMDGTISEVSWLRGSNRKPKPKPVVKYARPAPIKPKAVTTNTSYESLDSPPPPPSPKHVKGKTNKNHHNMKGRVEQPKNTVKPAAAAAAPNGKHAAGRRPKRAAALSTKTYKEPNSDDSQSESEKPPAPKTGRLGITKKTHEVSHPMKKKTASNQPTKRHVKPERNLQSSESESEQSSTSTQRRSENILQGSLKSNKKNVVSVKEQTNALKDSWVARQTSFFPSPPLIDKMRSAERSAPTLDLICSPLLTPRGSPLPASPDPACQDTPSPILLLPKPHSTGGSKGDFKPSSLYSAGKKPGSSKTQSVQSVPSLLSLRGQASALHAPIRTTAVEISPVQQHPSPAPPSPLSLSLPLLASTLIDLDKQSMRSPAQSPFPENQDCCYGLTTVSSVSQVSLSELSTKSSVLSCRVKDSCKTALTVSCKTEKTPPSDREVNSSKLDTSGPSRKRCISYASNSDEDEKEERKQSKMRRERSPRMKPRKLFKSFTEMSATGKVSRVLSSTHTMTSGDMDEDEDQDEDEDLELPELALKQRNMYQQFSSDLKKKFQNRCQMMEVYNKQSLVTVQQHVSSLNMQVTKYRTQKVSQVEKILLEEINKLEQDDTALKRMEKDLSIHWKKQSVAFRSYWEQQTMRDETLKKALQSQVCHSLEYEKKIYTSQMCLIRKDMKSVQDRLLGEMQEGEIQSVKRGLHSLFFPDGARF